MTPFAIGVVAGLAMLQASIAAPRTKFADCLQRAGSQAASQQVAPDQYRAFASQQCAAAGDGYKAALVNFDVKNGIKRPRAAADAQALIDDEIAMSAEKYEMRNPGLAKAKPVPTPNVTPAPVPAAAVKPDKSD